MTEQYKSVFTGSSMDEAILRMLDDDLETTGICSICNRESPSDSMDLHPMDNNKPWHLARWVCMWCWLRHS